MSMLHDDIEHMKKFVDSEEFVFVKEADPASHIFGFIE